MSERDDAVRPGREAHRLVDVETPLGAIYRREAVEPWRYQDLRDLFEQVAANRALGLIGHGAIADALKPDPADLPRVTDAIRAAVSTGQPYDLEYRVRHADGTTRWIEDHGCPKRSADGTVAWIDGVVFDVTERKQAEQGLIEQRALLEALMGTTPDHIYFKDADSRFTMISAAMARSFGLSDPSQAVGKTDFDFYAEEHARPAFEDEREIIKTGLPVVDLEERETWPDGRETWASTTKLPRIDGDGTGPGPGEPS